VEEFEENHLTSHQKRALQSRIERQKTRYFSGMSPQMIARSFSRVNELKKLGDPEAEKREIRLFEICSYKPS
jgi:hypothetical protein